MLMGLKKTPCSQGCGLQQRTRSSGCSLGLRAQWEHASNARAARRHSGAANHSTGTSQSSHQGFSRGIIRTLTSRKLGDIRTAQVEYSTVIMS
jgi:hypothetical protein